MFKDKGKKKKTKIKTKKFEGGTWTLRQNGGHQGRKTVRRTLLDAKKKEPALEVFSVRLARFRGVIFSRRVRGHPRGTAISQRILGSSPGTSSVATAAGPPWWNSRSLGGKAWFFGAIYNGEAWSRKKKKLARLAKVAA